MKTLIECELCHQQFWVKGTSPRPNEYTIHDDVDPVKEELCTHLIDDLFGNAILKDCESNEEY